MKAKIVSVEEERSLSKLEKPKGRIWDAPRGLILGAIEALQRWKKPSVFIQVNMTYLL